MTLTIHPGEARGTVRAPPSKSYTHRAFLLGLLADGGTVVRDALLSADPRSTLGVVHALGATVRDSDPDAIHVRSDGIVRTPEDVLDCGNSGTTLRLASAICALAPGTSVLTGDASLRKRPMKALLEGLASLGVRAESARDDGRAPVIIRGPLSGGLARLPGDVSSQYVSALLLAGARTPDGITIELASALKSRPYVDITIEMIEDFGGRVETSDGRYHVEGAQKLRGTDYRVPGDYSTAAFPLAAGALVGEVTVENLPERSAQGDRAFLDHLEAFGARVVRHGRSATVSAAPLKGVTIDLADTPDLFPILCALAAHAEGETRLTGAAHLRFKESDRIHAMVSNLRAMGVDAREQEDGAVIRGGKVHGALRLPTEDDHRILMATAICGLRATGPVSLVEHASHVVSYPAFLEDLAELGVRAEVSV